MEDRARARYNFFTPATALVVKLTSRGGGTEGPVPFLCPAALTRARPERVSTAPRTTTNLRPGFRRGRNDPGGPGEMLRMLSRLDVRQYERR